MSVIAQLEDSDFEEITDVIEGAIFDGRPSRKFITALIENDESFVHEGLEWGFHDTEVFSLAMNACSNFLIGQDWPKYGDVEDETFEDRLMVAYHEWVSRNI